MNQSILFQRFEGFTLLIVVVIAVAVLGFGIFVPLDSYTTTKGCPTENTPTERLRLIFGESLEDVKANDVEPPPNVGCTVNTRYELYLF